MYYTTTEYIPLHRKTKENTMYINFLRSTEDKKRWTELHFQQGIQNF